MRILESLGASFAKSKLAAAEVFDLVLGGAHQHAKLGISESDDRGMFVPQIQAAINYGA